MPKIFVHIINLLLVNNHPDAIIGDTEEEYSFKLTHKGRISALFWLIGQIFLLVPLHYTNSLYWSIAMFKNYFKIGSRNLVKEKLISIISIAGLGIGIAAAGLIMIFVHFETSYDKFFDDSDKIYRVYTDFSNSQEHDMGYGVVRGALTPALREISDVKATTSLYKFREADIKIGNERFNNLKIFSADSSFFNVFNYGVVNGSVENALTNPASAVITESMALKFWGKTDVVGKEMGLLTNFFENRTYNVLAVIQNPPANSHLKFDIF